MKREELTTYCRLAEALGREGIDVNAAANDFVVNTNLGPAKLVRIFEKILQQNPSKGRYDTSHIEVLEGIDVDSNDRQSSSSSGQENAPTLPPIVQSYHINGNDVQPVASVRVNPRRRPQSLADIRWSKIFRRNSDEAWTQSELREWERIRNELLAQVQKFRDDNLKISWSAAVEQVHGENVLYSPSDLNLELSLPKDISLPMDIS